MDIYVHWGLYVHLALNSTEKKRLVVFSRSHIPVVENIRMSVLIKFWLNIKKMTKLTAPFITFYFKVVSATTDYKKLHLIHLFFLNLYITLSHNSCKL